MVCFGESCNNWPEAADGRQTASHPGNLPEERAEYTTFQAAQLLRIGLGELLALIETAPLPYRRETEAQAIGGEGGGRTRKSVRIVRFRIGCRRQLSACLSSLAGGARVKLARDFSSSGFRPDAVVVCRLSFLRRVGHMIRIRTGMRPGIGADGRIRTDRRAGLS